MLYFDVQNWGQTANYQVNWLSGTTWCALIDGDEKACIDLSVSVPAYVVAQSEVHDSSQNELNTDFSEVFYLDSNNQWIYFSQTNWVEQSPYMVNKIQYYLYNNYLP